MNGWILYVECGRRKLKATVFWFKLRFKAENFNKFFFCSLIVFFKKERAKGMVDRHHGKRAQLARGRPNAGGRAPPGIDIEQKQSAGTHGNSRRGESQGSETGRARRDPKVICTNPVRQPAALQGRLNKSDSMPGGRESKELGPGVTVMSYLGPRDLAEEYTRRRRAPWDCEEQQSRAAPPATSDLAPPTSTTIQGVGCCPTQMVNHARSPPQAPEHRKKTASREYGQFHSPIGLSFI